MESMRTRSCNSFQVDARIPATAAERYRSLKAYERLRGAGCSEETALERPGFSRRTLYR